MKVAVAVIIDNARRVLITRRALSASHGGYWEFPGGKVEAGELESQALIREIHEEVGLDIIDHQLIGEIKHQYAQKHVHLLIFMVTKFNGTASRLEGQMDLCWANLDELTNYQFPEANHQIIDMIHSVLQPAAK